MASMRIERMSARAFLNKIQAQALTKAAYEDSTEKLLHLFKSYPDSAIAWETSILGQGKESGMAVAYMRDLAEDDDLKVASYRKPVNVQPLVSGGAIRSLKEREGCLPLFDISQWLNLNNPRFSGDAYPWIGSLPDQSLEEVWVPWVYIDVDEPQIVGRYAYFIEDESFKINLFHAGGKKRDDDSSAIDTEAISLRTLFMEAGSTYQELAELTNQIVESRDAYADLNEFLDLGMLERFAGDDRRWTKDLRYLITPCSGTLNVSRAGWKKLDLNDVVQDVVDPEIVRSQLDQIVETIKKQLPNFGQRFYRAPGQLNQNELNDSEFVIDENEAIYIEKIAANIRDYIDKDSLPTVVANSLQKEVQLGSKPVFALGMESFIDGAANAVMAYGKEAVPYLHEMAVRYQLLKMDPPKYGSEAEYEFTLDYYFEFWNVTNKDITVSDLGPNAFIKVYNQTAWDTAGGTFIDEGRDFEIPLVDFRDGNNKDLIFKAGDVTVLTTDGNPSSRVLAVDSEKIYRPQDPDRYLDIDGHSSRLFQGVTRSKNSSSYFRLKAMPRSTSASDYETEVLIGNDYGILESVSSVMTVLTLSLHASKEEYMEEPEQYFFRGSSLKAGIPSQPGDPRANHEQLYLQRYSKDFYDDQTRFFSTGLSNSKVPANSTLGVLSNKWLKSDQWVDYFMLSTGVAYAPARMSDDKLKSVGQLGGVYDPARFIRINSEKGIRYSRGGGRTLKIGQSEFYDEDVNPSGVWDGHDHSKSTDWRAWRLLDIFTRVGEVELPGLININGIRRDGGIAFRALFDDYVFRNIPDSDPQMAAQTLKREAVDEMLLQMKNYLDGGRINILKAKIEKEQGSTPTNNRVFWERGELSEMPVFSRGQKLCGVDLSEVLERGKEELFERIAELICTRGNVFSIYCVGQALERREDGSEIILATDAQKKLVKLEPVFEKQGLLEKIVDYNLVLLKTE
ncbi:MAG: hypothetical protein AAF984_02170 [Verrucomicrobiota bacterium]